jgi:LysM repeat protein
MNSFSKYINPVGLKKIPRDKAIGSSITQNVVKVVVLIFTLLNVQCFAQESIQEMIEKEQAQKEYIKKFKDDAVKEMYLHHIPASIVLAQAILESNSGRSELATNANNHFGIKCKKEWGGDSYLKDDDEQGECFRKYNNVLESYSDHSIFLLSRVRYAFLFQISLSDYRAWCFGLKEAGYATDPNYAYSLINIIEKHELYQFDKHELLAKADPVIMQEEKNPELTMKEIYNFNQTKFIITKPNDSYFKIASEYGIEIEKLMAYNEIKRGEKIVIGQKLFLEPKREKAKEPFHVVQKGETLSIVAQIHGVKLGALCKNNHLSPGDPLKTGDILYLRGKKPVEQPIEAQEIASQAIISGNNF